MSTKNLELEKEDYWISFKANMEREIESLKKHHKKKYDKNEFQRIGMNLKNWSSLKTIPKIDYENMKRYVPEKHHEEYRKLVFDWWVALDHTYGTFDLPPSEKHEQTMMDDEESILCVII
jgi:hypothetical protein